MKIMVSLAVKQGTNYLVVQHMKAFCSCNTQYKRWLLLNQKAKIMTKQSLEKFPHLRYGGLNINFLLKRE